MATNPKKEICDGCYKSIYIHQKVLICCLCNSIAHHKCGKDKYFYNQIIDQWHCCNCNANVISRYNPFDTLCSNEYLIDEPEAYAEIEKVKGILKNCEIITKSDLDRKCFGYETLPFSIFYNNIDGLAANFDTLHAQLETIKNKFDVLAFAETNIDEIHKKSL